MNRYDWTRQKINELLNDRALMETFPGMSTSGGQLLYQGKNVIADEDIDDYIASQIKTNAPLSIHQMHLWCYERVWGISRRKIAEWFKKQATYQRLRRRPPGSVNRQKRASVEQSTSWVVERFPDAVGIDLLRIPNSFSNWTNLVVVVHRRSNKLYARPIKGATAQATLTAFKHILSDILRQFAMPEIVECDNGSEMKAIFSQFLKEKGIQRRVLRMVPYVEKKNGTLMKYISYLMDEGVGWDEALPLAIKKVNTIVSRITKTRADLVPRYAAVSRVHRKVKQPKKQPEDKLPKGTIVRHLSHKAEGKGGTTFYKAYLRRNWSAQYPIEKVIKIRNEKQWKYLVNGKYYKLNQIQVIRQPYAAGERRTPLRRAARKAPVPKLRDLRKEALNPPRLKRR